MGSGGEKAPSVVASRAVDGAAASAKHSRVAAVPPARRVSAR